MSGTEEILDETGTQGTSAPPSVEPIISEEASKEALETWSKKSEED